MSAPRTTHWEAMLHVVKYLKEAPGRGIWFKNHGHYSVIGYFNADWAACPIDRRSTCGCCVLLGGNLVSWKSKKQ